MPRACSKLVMLLPMLLLMLSVASPALAAGKKKKAAPAEEAETAEEAAPEEKSTDDLMGEAVKKGSAKKKGTEEAKPAEGEAAPAADAELGTQETPGEASSWERPPEEAEKPKKDVSAPVVEKAGDGRPWMAGLILGWGLKTDSNTGGLGADPYGLTAGLRGGYTLDFNLYVGLFFQYYLGSSESGRQARVNTGVSETTASAMAFGAEGGYDFWIGSVILRPSLQIGANIAFTNVTGESLSVSDMVLGPGLNLIVPIDEWFLGGDLRPMFIIGDSPPSLLIALHGGLRFQ